MESQRSATSLADMPGGGEPDAYREMPRNTDAEQALLGAILVDNEAYDKVSTFLEPDHFHIPVHGRIYNAARILILRGQIATPITLKAFFDNDEGLADIGGSDYLHRLSSSAVSIINAEDYGRTIYDLGLRRDLIRLGEDMVNIAFDPEVEDTAASQIERSEQRLYELAETGQHEGGFKPFNVSLTEAVKNAEAAYKRDGRLSGVATGLIDLDNLLGGLHRSDLIILAGRPSMGKTALATNIAFHAAKSFREEEDENGQRKVVDGAVVGFFSLEMSAEQLASRILSEQAEISSDKMRKGEVPSEQFLRLSAAAQTLHTLPIFIDDTPALTVSALRTRARRLKRQNNLGLIIVDYLQLLQGSNKSRSDGRVQEVSEITRGLKTLAKELDVPVLALSQLSRQVENRDDKRPQLADLRESGSIEQDADIVMFIYREEYYLEKSKPKDTHDKYIDEISRWEERMDKCRNLADVIIAKQRHGPVGTVNLIFRGEFTRFSDADLHHTTYNDR